MKKLHRIQKDHKIAGVCSGMAEYLQVDPVFIRLFFVVMMCVGGLGALLYGIMWMLIPEKKRGRPSTKSQSMQMYLSSKDQKIFGVCGGMGEYFDLDPSIFRVMFIVLAVMGGLGILAYGILCLVVPKKPVTRRKAAPKAAKVAKVA